MRVPLFDEEVEMVVVVHVDVFLAHGQAILERFAAELRGIFKVKLIMETFDFVKASRTPASSGVPTLSQSG